MTSELKEIESIAREAGEIALRFYGNVTAEYKDADSPVTAADRASNEYIVKALREAFPGDAILSEESHDSLDRLSAKRVWMPSWGRPSDKRPTGCPRATAKCSSSATWRG